MRLRRLQMKKRIVNILAFPVLIGTGIPQGVKTIFQLRSVRGLP